MTDTPNRKGYAYDIFISHNRADKEWVRVLTERLAGEQYNGRRLRPWLDEHFLNPGELGSESELTTAMDRSRFLGLVLSPEALASQWVDFEVQYFLGARGGEALIPMLRRTCTVPPALSGLPTLDFTDEGGSGESLAALVAKLCPAGGVQPEEVKSGVDAAFERVESSDPGGYGPGPSPERDAFFGELTRYDIDDAVSEGLAVAAFDRAAEHLQRISADGSHAAYNYKMLLGECLAAALHHSASYRQVAQRYIDTAGQQPDHPPVLLFVLARAYSKLAEIDPRLVDASVLMRLIARLDAADSIGNEERAIEALLARTVGKLRATAAGELLLKTLSEGGRTSRIVTAGAVSISYKRDAPVFYISELGRLDESRAQQQEPAGKPPSRALLGLLDALELDQHESVALALKNAKEELEENYPGIDFPISLFWLDVRRGEEVSNLHNAPFMGTVVKATLGNMVELADKVGVANVACLTEPRVVDALFDKCGALLILPQESDSPQCRRLRDRGIPFGVASSELMSGLSDGEHVVVREQGVNIRRASA